MATCEECGAALAEGDAFCGACGAFTDWNQSPGDEVAAPGAVADQPAASGAVVAAVAAAPVEPSAPTPRGASPGAGPAATGQRPEPPAVDPGAAVLPGRPTLERLAPVPAPQGYQASPDDVRCVACGSANPRGRSFCRICGRSLAEEPEVVRLRWWQRFAAWYGERRRRRRLARRRGSARWLRRIVSLAVVLGVVGAGVYVVKPHIPRILGDVRNRIAKPVPVNPQTVTASSAAAGHPAAAAADGSSATWWAPAPGAGGSAAGQWLEADFATPFTLFDVVVFDGSAQQQSQFLLEARAEDVVLTAWTAKGASVHRTIHLLDESAQQQFRVAVPDVVRVRLTIESAYGEAPGRLTALAEVDFFTTS